MIPDLLAAANLWSPDMLVVSFTIAPPAISHINPASVPELSTCTYLVTITGKDFLPYPGTTHVRFGTMESPDVRVVSPEELLAKVPMQPRGDVSLTVTTPAPNGTSNPVIFTL